MKELKEGQIAVRYDSDGETVDEINLLLSPKATLTIIKNDDNTVEFITSDVDFNNKDLSGSLSYSTLDTLIRYLATMKNQIRRDATI